MSATSHWQAILNPAAGGGRAARRWPDLARALAARGVVYRLAVTRAPGHATDLAAQAHAGGARHFLAVGGDGTLHEVLNGLPLEGGRVTIAIAPLGSGNDWARGLGIPARPAALAAILAQARTVAHDVGLLSCEGDRGRIERRFLNVAGTGYDADVLDRLPTRVPRALRYPIAVVRGIARYVPPRLRIATDDALYEEPFLVAFAALGPYCGGRLWIAPKAEPGNGHAELVAIRALAPLSALRRLPKLYRGRLADDPAVITGRSRALTVSSDRPSGVEADGQRLGSTPLHIRVAQGAIDAVVP